MDKIVQMRTYFNGDTFSHPELFESFQMWTLCFIDPMAATISSVAIEKKNCDNNKIVNKIDPEKAMCFITLKVH